jgi:hypothetical protein
VASVVVEPASATLLVGGSQTFAATARDANANVLPGRTISWTSSNPNVASVSPTGIVTGVAPGGPVTITATSEGKGGSAPVTVVPPVASVIITGAPRVKVGDTYTYAATARLADGTPVVRPMTWSVSDPARGTMTAAGTLVPLLAGTIVVRVTIDGTAWEGTTVAYDWTAFGNGTTQGITLASDNSITNRFGSSEFPELTVGCTQNTLLIFVDTDLFVTRNGVVAYSFDGGPPQSQTWVESSDFSTLIYPSLSNQTTLAFAGQIAASRSFAFAFTEFNSSAKAVLFRVTGLTSRLATMAPACQLSNSRVATGLHQVDAVMTLLTSTGAAPIMSADVGRRKALGYTLPGAPGLRLVPERSSLQRARRRD